MALNTVTVNLNNVVLPNGQLYQSGQLAVLSDEQFAKIDPAYFEEGSPHLTITAEDDATAECGTASYT